MQRNTFRNAYKYQLIIAEKDDLTALNLLGPCHLTDEDEEL